MTAKLVTMLFYELGDLELKTESKLVECNSNGAIISDKGLPEGAILVTVFDGVCEPLKRNRELLA